MSFGKRCVLIGASVRLTFSAFDDVAEKVAVACGWADGIDKPGVVAGGVVAPPLKVTVFVHFAYYLVVVFDNKVLGEGIPALHHAVGISDAFAVEVVATVGGSE